jgi:hypothetical protein
MTAIVLPDIDFEQLKKNIPSLADIELPSMEHAGKRADETIDRLLGRSRTPTWPWIAAGVFVVALIGTVAAFFTWTRRASWERDTEPWSESGTAKPGSDATTSMPDLGRTTATDPDMSGLTAAESSLMSTDLSERDRV